MILKCQRVIYSRLMPNLVVAVYKKIPHRNWQGNFCIFRPNSQTVSYIFALRHLLLPLSQLCL